MEQKIRIGAVSYLNTKPMITAQPNPSEGRELNVEWVLDYPAKIATMLLEDKIDIGLVPVAVIPLMKEYYIVSNYGIACNGIVASVCLFSEVSIEEIETIYLDYQSKTSVQLLKILLKEYWKKEVTFINGAIGFETKINGTTAALVIGDRAFELSKKHSYIYDLGEAWKQYTGLPFVFATWISNKKIDEQFSSAFTRLIENNISQFFMSQYAASLKKEEIDYLKNNIIYYLSNDCKLGLHTFLQKL